MHIPSIELWKKNTPADFWHTRQTMEPELWQQAAINSLSLLGLPENNAEMENVLALVLGEQRFGPNHWQLSFPKTVYYMVKPALPRLLTQKLRGIYNRTSINGNDHWPIDARYAEFLWEVMRQVLLLSGKDTLEIRNFWPGRNRFAFVITHDVECATGQDFVRAVADMDESLGFCSSFNFVPERYKLDHNLMDELRRRGFEIGVHGLNHDGRLFQSKEIFTDRAAQINKYLKKWQAVGFRADLTHRQPDWMQCLDIEYDLSFFDTDPYEPIPGGTMSVWPFMLGRFVELPYTLVQDYTLTSIINESSPRVWLYKVDFIQKYHGMALVNSHPDYLRFKNDWNVYKNFLVTMKNNRDYWQALPRDVARWWHTKSACQEQFEQEGSYALAYLQDGHLEIDLCA